MRLGSVAAFGVGYLLGSRAGRERYERVLAAARRAAVRLDEYGRLDGTGFRIRPPG